MFAGPRKSITQLFTGTVERELIGKEISHPTKAIATRAWAADQKTMDIGGNFDDDDIASNRNVEALQTELRHTHMSLLAERSRVQELERELIGKEISHPTKAIATRAWAADQKTMDIGGNFDDDDIASNRNVEALQTELRHTHMSLLAERSRVQELERELIGK
eukprot:540598_1